MIASETTVRWRRRRLVHTKREGISLIIVILVLALALLGPLFAPHAPDAIIGVPFTAPGDGTLLGTDFLGRDLLSRILWGGQDIVLIAAVATGLAYIVGATIGLAAGHSRAFLDSVLMRGMDVLLAFPPILFLLVLATGAGPSRLALIAGITIIHVPSIARVIRAATLDVTVRGYVEAAVARGERLSYILFSEILPNIRSTIVADAGPRLTLSILLIAAVNFLGLGLRPPAADWALMISENRVGLTLQPWPVVVPAALIAILTVAVNTLADEVARRRGGSADQTLILR
jgi:peptide/nickel transport system permease protein